MHEPSVATAWVAAELGLGAGDATGAGAWDSPQAELRDLLQVCLTRHPQMRPHLDAMARSLVDGTYAAHPDRLAAADPARTPVPPVILATMLGATDAVDAICQVGGRAALTARDALGNTALHWAAILGHDGLAARLAARGLPETILNLVDGRPQDYRDMWQQGPPEALDLAARRRDGTALNVRTQADCRAAFGFTFLQRTRPGVDFILQTALRLFDPAWGEQARALLLGPDAHRLAAAPEPAAVLCDDGPPWEWGLYLREPVAEGQLVRTYVGELVTTASVGRGQRRDGPNAYACQFAPTAGLGALFGCHFDGWRQGNLGTRANGAHVAAAANLEVHAGFARGLPHIDLIARHDIAAGRQVAWDYGPGYWRGVGIVPAPLPSPPTSP